MGPTTLRSQRCRTETVRLGLPVRYQEKPGWEMRTPPPAVHASNMYSSGDTIKNAAFALVDRMLEPKGSWLAHAIACKQLHEIERGGRNWPASTSTLMPSLRDALLSLVRPRLRMPLICARSEAELVKSAPCAEAELVKAMVSFTIALGDLQPSACCISNDGHPACLRRHTADMQALPSLRLLLRSVGNVRLSAAARAALSTSCSACRAANQMSR